MNNFFKLVKINIASLIVGKTKKKGLRIFGLIFLAIYLLGILGAMSYLMAVNMQETGQYAFLLVMGNIISFVFILLMIISSSTTIFYKSKDNDLLLTLPIKKHIISLSKCFTIYVLGFSYTLLFLLPVFCVYFMFKGITITSLLAGLISLFVVPIIPTVIGIFLSSFFSLFIGKSKHKNLITTIALFVFFILFMVFYYSIDFSSLAMDTALQGKISKYSFYILPIKWFVDAVDKTNMLSLLLLVLSSFALAFLTVWFTSKTFLKIASAYKNNNSTNKKIKTKKTNVVLSLVKKESKRFFNSTIYIFNCGMGLLLSLAVPILAIVYKDTLFQLAEMLGITKLLIALIVGLAYSFLVSTCSTTSVSLSLERNCAFYLKVLPISVNQILLSKLLFNVILQIPFLIIGALFCTIFFKLSILHFLIIIAVCLMFSLLNSTIGVFCNLFLPKMNAQNDTAIIKQSFSSLLGVFIPMGIFMIIVLLGATVFFSHIYIYSLIALLIAFVITTVLVCLLFKFGEKLFNKIKL